MRRGWCSPRCFLAMLTAYLIASLSLGCAALAGAQGGVGEAELASRVRAFVARTRALVPLSQILIVDMSPPDEGGLRKVVLQLGKGTPPVREVIYVTANGREVLEGLSRRWSRIRGKGLVRNLPPLSLVRRSMVRLPLRSRLSSSVILNALTVGSSTANSDAFKLSYLIRCAGCSLTFLLELYTLGQCTPQFQVFALLSKECLRSGGSSRACTRTNSASRTRRRPCSFVPWLSAPASISVATMGACAPPVRLRECSPKSMLEKLWEYPGRRPYSSTGENSLAQYRLRHSRRQLETRLPSRGQRGR